MRKKKFLFVTEEDLDFLLVKLKQEGHELRVYSEERGTPLEGFLQKADVVTSWKPWVDWADVMVFDGASWGSAPDRLRKQGKRVIGGSPYTDKLENDREFGQHELKRVGLRILKEVESSSVQKVISHIHKNPGRYVLKPCGDHEVDTTMIGEFNDGRDLIELLEHNKKRFSGQKFFLQEYVKGVEIAVGGFFNGREFVEPINVNVEHKRLFTGNLGPLVWEMGTFVHYTNKRNPLFTKTLGKLRDRFREAGYVGYLDVNCIVNAKGIHPLEFTCRFGYPIAAILWEGNRARAGDTLWNLVEQKECSWSPRKGFACGAVIALPPFPYQDQKELEKYRGSLLRLKSEQGMYFFDVAKLAGKLVTTDYSPLVVAAHHSSPAKARELMYQRIRSISLENMYYRTDIGSRWEKESRLLKQWGYL